MPASRERVLHTQAAGWLHKQHSRVSTGQRKVPGTRHAHHGAPASLSSEPGCTIVSCCWKLLPDVQSQNHRLPLSAPATKRKQVTMAKRQRCGDPRTQTKKAQFQAADAHSPLAMTPSWLTAMQFTIACTARSAYSSAEWAKQRPSRSSRGSLATPPCLTRCCCRKLCRKSPCGSLNFFRLSAAPGRGHRGEDEWASADPYWAAAGCGET